MGPRDSAAPDRERWEETIADLIAEAETVGDPAVRSASLRRAAEIYETRLGDREKSLAVWQAALNEDFTNPAAAQGLERAATALGCAHAVIAECESLLPEVTDPRQHEALLAFIVNWSKQLEGTPTPMPVVIDAETPALVGESAGRLLERLDQAVALGNWRQAVDVLLALAAGESGMMRAKYLGTAGQILHRKLGREDEAIDLLNRSLDAYPNDLKAFERIFRILAGRKAYPDAESNLLKMIARIKTSDHPHKNATLEALWRKLGDVYRLGLRDLTAAANAYSVCARLAPDDPRYPKMLADIAERQGR